MLNGHFQTASTIFPCLDTFDVRLFWKVHHSSFIEHHHHHHHRYTQSFDPIVKLSTTKNNNDNLNIRHLIRLYWTDKDVVDKVLLSAAVKHQQLKQQQQQQQLHRQSQWPSLSHFLKKKKKMIIKNNNNKKIHYWTNQTNPYSHNNQRQQGNHHYQFFYYYSTRPSTLIEMKKFHYVREYSLDMIRMDNDNHTDAIHNHHNGEGQTNANTAATVIGDGGQIKIDCNTFQPNEDIYYCLVYLILYKNAVLYENIPHCIPTIDKQQQQQQQPNGNFVHLDSFTKSSSSSSVFRDIVGQHRAVSSSSSYPSEIKFNYNSNNNNDNNNDESVMNSSSSINAQIKLKTLNENYNSSSYNNEYESFIQKNVDDDENENYSQRMSTSINHNAFSDVKILVNNSSLNNRNPSNIRFVQQQPKQNTFQQRKSLNQIDTIIVRTHACSCKLNSNEIFNDHDVNHVNQKKFETLNIVDALLLDDDHYLFNHMSVGDVNSDVVDDDDEEKNLKKLNSNKMKMKKKRKKNKRIDQANNNEEESDNEKKQKQIPMHNKNDAKNNNNSSLNEFDSYNRMDEYYYQNNNNENPTTAAVCIISIDKPEKYLFKLLNIEPSMDWLVENPRLATYFTETIFNDNNDNNNSSNLDVSSIDYSHFLVVRNGRLSIDPQINIIENHSQIHYLQSNYLRLEALSSMNLTIKFQKRSYYRRFKQQQSFSNNNNDTDKTTTICNQQRKNNRNNANNNNNNDNNVIEIDSIITNSNDEMNNKSIDSFSSINEYHIQQTICCDNRQESSSSSFNRQRDYYDIYEPLTMKIIDATKSITNTFEKSNNHIPFVNERQIVNSDDQDDGSTIQHSSLLQKQPRSPSKLPLLTTSNTLTFGNHNNHSSSLSFVHSQNLPINQLIIIEQETKQQQQLQTLPSIKHNNHHHYIKPVLLKTFMSDQNHYE
ncbi:hypothetical protein DERP_002770 [Dermatophagoides pteronyssinus]|uniref:GATA zinc finger domain-containing protein 14-like n=1 Tax=Dermatophagoides pteronyssinus TaxID=6956 RepID=A0ABQ8JWJ8_DERPT|nr:hypothetical protein DERP_002770 [Dermatophagoides pteronyssinus]